MTTEHKPVTEEEAFGPYLVYERIGIGGMATVHRAKERGIEGFERIVALKRLLPHLAEDAGFVRSFVREAKLASMLQHANIVQLYELGRVGPVYFISMELIEGHDVRKILRRARKITGPPPLPVFLSLMSQLLDALHYAHRRCDASGDPLGLVHRDVSPSNLLVTHEGHLKVIDFGIAKAQSIKLRTQTGRVKGKLAYLAPEAIKGQDLDARSDIFSAGIIAHELLTARPLFATKNEYQTLMRVQRADVERPSSINQNCPAALDDIVLRALARNPANRWQNAAEFRDALHSLRMQYRITASNREVSAWMEWAFSLDEPPTGVGSRYPSMTDSFSAIQSVSGFGGTPSDVYPPSPYEEYDSGQPARGRQRRTADEDMAAYAWGNDDEADGAVLLDEVPDYSERTPRSNEPAPLPPPPTVRASSVIDSGADPYIPSLAAPDSSETITGALGPSRSRPGTSHPPPRAGAPSRSRSRMGAPGPGESQMHARNAARAGRAYSGHGDIGYDDGYDDDGGLADRLEPEQPQAPAPLAKGSRPLPEAARAIAFSDPEDTGFGAAIVEQHKRQRVRLALIGLALIGAAAGAYFVMGKSGSSGMPAATATLKFAVEPSDVTIDIEGVGAHEGSPYRVEVAPGTYQVKITREGYKSWVSRITLEDKEFRTVQTELQQGQGNKATINVRTTPEGLTVTLDGEPVEGVTPVSVEVEPGKHVIVVSKGGAELFREEYDTIANTQYMLREDLADEIAQLAARVARDARDVRRRQRDGADTTDEPSEDDDALDAVVVEPERPEGPARAALPDPSVAGGVATNKPSTLDDIKMKAPPPVAPAPRVPAGPVTALPSEIRKRSGRPPRIRMRGDIESAKASAKLCIDASGKVTSASMFTELPGDTARAIESALEGWRYAPVMRAGKPVAACFAIHFTLDFRN